MISLTGRTFEQPCAVDPVALRAITTLAVLDLGPPHHVAIVQVTLGDTQLEMQGRGIALKQLQVVATSLVPAPSEPPLP